MLDKKKILKIQFWAVFIIVIFLSILFIFFDPKELISGLGITEGYLLAFFISLFGGVSVFTSAFFYSSIVTLVIHGFNFIALGLISGMGLFIGDSFIFYLGKKGRESFELSNYPRIEKFSNWLIAQPYFVIVVVIILYGLTPFPNDLLMIALSVFGYSYRKVFIPLLLADIAIVTLVGYLASIGKSLF